MPFFNFKGFQQNATRVEPTKGKDAYANVAPYAYIPDAYNNVEPYVYLDGGENELRIQMSRQGGDIDLNELIPGMPAPVFNGLNLPDFIKVIGTTMRVGEVPQDIDDEVRFQIEAEN